MHLLSVYLDTTPPPNKYKMQPDKIIIPAEIQEFLEESPTYGFSKLIDCCRYHESNELKIQAILLAGKYELATASEKYNANTGADKAALIQEAKFILEKLENVISKNNGDGNGHTYMKAKKNIVIRNWPESLPGSTTAKSRYVFKCQGVKKNYGRSDFTLSGISLQLKEGEITGIVGMNGYGKSTLLKIIAGELMPDEGEVSYEVLNNEKKVKNWPLIKSHIAFLQQDVPVLNGNIKKSLKFSASMHGLKGKNNEDEVNYVISRLGLSGYENALWKDLSGGYRLRCALAKVLVCRPRLIVLDEPLANLDINTQMLVLNDLRKMTDIPGNRMSVVISSQNLEEVEAIADKMLVLNKGKIQHYGESSIIGINRTENVFELKTPLEKDELKTKLKGINYSRIDFNGFYFILTAPVVTDKLSFLKYCTENEIVLDYFNDISSSVKKLIIQNQ